MNTSQAHERVGILSHLVEESARFRSEEQYSPNLDGTRGTHYVVHRQDSLPETHEDLQRQVCEWLSLQRRPLARRRCEKRYRWHHGNFGKTSFG